MPSTFSRSSIDELNHLIDRYPTKQAVLLPALHLAQKEFGYLHHDALKAVAAFLDLSIDHVNGVATFYSMLRQKPSGTNVLRVCTNISCMLRGAYDVLRSFESELKLSPGESNDMFTLVEEECIAACSNAPAVLCGTSYFYNVTPDQVVSIVNDLRDNPQPEYEAMS